MRTFALVLACLVSAGHAVKETTDMKALATLLEAFSPASSFNPSGPALRSPGKLGAPIQLGKRTADAFMGVVEETQDILKEVMLETFGKDVEIDPAMLEKPEALQPMYDSMKEKAMSVTKYSNKLSQDNFDEFKKGIADVDAFFKDIGVDNSFEEKAELTKKLDDLWATYSKLLKSEIELEKDLN
mmetsp:Transcript_131804/g.229153  ORF Transcript_131804/g.229153 Transcript_131804/m.229153 type:complete len:185 (-) Transcript_131804:135-689(-)